MRFSKLNFLKLAALVVACFAIAGFAWTGSRFSPPKVDNTFVGTLSDTEKEAVSVAAFDDMAKVFFSARCANCHPAGDIPTQGDAMTPHAQAVTRGPEGRGVYGMKCNTCHQGENLEGEHMPPGADNWHMPTSDHKMPFQGLTNGQLCRNLKDPKKNGGHTTAQSSINHILKRDRLVMWAWEPGNGRTVPPMSFDEFTAKINEWLKNGAACPE